MLKGEPPSLRIIEQRKCGGFLRFHQNKDGRGDFPRQGPAGECGRARVPKINKINKKKFSENKTKVSLCF